MRYFETTSLYAESPPAWGRGLKLEGVEFESTERIVAPRVGAWIETLSIGKFDSGKYVAPRVGAWIETFKDRPALTVREVAPRVGAWIETSSA